MTIDTSEISRFISTQLTIFNSLPCQSDFNRGLIEGLNLVKQYITMYEEHEGKQIAVKRGEQE